jgi:hypothetical protein
VEERLKSGYEPRKTVKLYTHIIPAVRLLKHVREGYQEEIKHGDSALRALDSLNMSLANLKGANAEGIATAIAQLKEFDSSELAAKHVAVKSIVARARLSQTVEMLEKAMALPPGQRGMQLSRACAVFVSLRSRLGQWRDRQIAGIMEYNYQKECALRVERDNWLLSQLSKFAAAPEKVFAYDVFDSGKLRLLTEVRTMIKARKPPEAILPLLKSYSHLFRVNERERPNAEDRIALMENGIMPNDGRKVDYQIGHYGWLYRYVRSKDTAKALDKLEYIRLFVKANKPRFVFCELAREPDSYLAPVLRPMQTALSAYSHLNFSAARAYFAAARDELKKFVAPEKVS